MRYPQAKPQRDDGVLPRRREQHAKFWSPTPPDPREESLRARNGASAGEWLDEWTLKPTRQ